MTFRVLQQDSTVSSVLISADTKTGFGNLRLSAGAANTGATFQSVHIVSSVTKARIKLILQG